jgi:beta-phosphoglucomutase
MKKIKVILFDMDGVLIDAKEWHYEALNKALELFGMTISRYDHLVTYDGLPTIKKLEILSTEKGLPQGLHDFINSMKQQYTKDQIHQKCKPYFPHEYALSRLQQENYRMAVCSNSIRESINLMMDKAALSQYMEFIISNQDVEKPKPDPAMYNLGITKMKVSPQEVIIVEDNPIGIKAAKATGAHVLEVKDVSEVNYRRITDFILHVEKELNQCH